MSICHRCGDEIPIRLDRCQCKSYDVQLDGQPEWHSQWALTEDLAAEMFLRSIYKQVAVKNREEFNVHIRNTGHFHGGHPYKVMACVSIEFHAHWDGGH